MGAAISQNSFSWACFRKKKEESYNISIELTNMSHHLIVKAQAEEKGHIT